MMTKKTALVLVDLQNDFLPGGALGVKDGDKIIPVVNGLLKHSFDLVVATKDWHPPDHGSFATTHGKEPGKHIMLGGVDQILWPVHCVQGTFGAQYSKAWDCQKVEKVFFKGTDKDVDSYSTFFDNDRRKSTGLEGFLREKGITDLYFAGLTLEYCVKYSALDAALLGFNIYVIEDGCKPVNLQKDDGARALEEMTRAGVNIINSSDLITVDQEI